MGAGVAHAIDDVAAAGIRDGHRRDRRTARRQLVNGGGVQIGVGGHRQGSRNRRGGHDQLVRMEALLQPFFPQRQALMHAKAVLFVDDHQREAVKLHLLLEDGMGADNHLHLTASDGVLLRKTRFALLFSGKPAHLNAQRGEPGAEVIRVLLCQQFRRRHQRHLLAVGNGAQGCQGSNQRFT